ncbi:glycosyltransferase family A protein [Lachnospiraceae bacterium 29-91]
MYPLVSVIMPAYNGEKYIGEAIESILNQTYDNFELVIVEDKSTDNTLNVIQKYKDPRIFLHLNSQNQGIAYSTNLGIAKSKGKYIALLDDDDIATKQRLEWQTSFMEEHDDVDILGGRSAIIDKNGDFLRYDLEPLRNPKFIKALLLFSNEKFANCSAMIRKSFIEKNDLKYQDNCLGMQDFKFYIDSSKVGTITSIDRLVHLKRIHDEEETYRSMKFHAAERAELFAQFQKESLRKSGFRLEEKHLLTINEILSETVRKSYTEEEATRLYRAFKEILQQAKEMKIDYIKELEQVCKKLLLKKILVRSDFFGIGLM